MAQVHINNIIVGNNPCSILAPFTFDITFECFSNLPGTFDWKLIYIGSPNNQQCDQVIDSFDMDNLAVGVLNFKIESNPPNFNLIPQEEIIGTTAIIISVAYEKQEFFRCGYYVRNQYDESLPEPPKDLNLQLLKRYILSDSPRIFRFQIQWTQQQGKAVQDQQLLQQSIAMMGGDPFENAHVGDKLQQLQYSYGMFQGQQ